MNLYTANQTLFFPPMYMIDRFWQVKTLVFMQEAQFTKFGHQARAEILTKSGPQLVIVPLKNRSFRSLNEIEIDQPAKWLGKFEKTLTTVYGRCDGFKSLGYDLIDRFEEMILDGRTTIADLGKTSIVWTLDKMGIDTEIKDSVDLIGPRPDDASQWVFDMGLAVNATDYLGGGTAMQAYIDYELFENGGIRLWHQEWDCAGYQSLSEVNVNGWISCLDPLMVGGTELMWELLYSSKRRLVRTSKEYCYTNRKT